MLRGGRADDYFPHDQMDVDAVFGRPSPAAQTSFTLQDIEADETLPAAKKAYQEKKMARKEQEKREKSAQIAASWAADTVVDESEQDVSQGKGTIWVIGGRKHEISIFGIKSTMRWNSAAESWQSMPEMKYERINCAAVKLGRKVYVAGGWHTTCE
jgi:hypothetical protein